MGAEMYNQVSVYRKTSPFEQWHRFRRISVSESNVFTRCRAISRKRGICCGMRQTQGSARDVLTAYCGSRTRG
ncbi:hypothetical protein IEO21_09397 [Rhodonia placenta]|uniref:Uncharacterized protein n=1 Tax=Rhodonia placenta TaxID=104341 RepID=A0A8H7TYG4_9APHY|nr:hypothetical protein IEO21_09397 [Postia placenta]